jgi:purine-binding chemotaxis protein CheW
MSTEAASRSKSATDLHREFDETFAVPPPVSVEHESLIMLRVAGEALAVRTLDITGVAKRRRILPIPTRVPGLLGITAIRGQLIPVYDLATLLELPSAAGAGSWLMLANPEAPIGLIFDEFEGQLDIEGSCLYESDGSDSRKYLGLMARAGAARRAVIDVPGLVKEIRQRAQFVEAAKE